MYSQSACLSIFNGVKRVTNRFCYLFVPCGEAAKDNMPLLIYCMLECGSFSSSGGDNCFSNARSVAMCVPVAVRGGVIGALLCRTFLMGALYAPCVTCRTVRVFVARSCEIGRVHSNQIFMYWSPGHKRVSSNFGAKRLLRLRVYPLITARHRSRIISPPMHVLSPPRIGISPGLELFLMTFMYWGFLSKTYICRSFRWANRKFCGPSFWQPCFAI
jgi:hypothetical protein